MITRKSPAEIEKMRRSGRIVAEVLALMESELKPGVSTGDLDRLAERGSTADGELQVFEQADDGDGFTRLQRARMTVRSDDL